MPRVPEQIDVPIVRQLLERENGHDVLALPVDVRARSFCVQGGGDEIVDHVSRIVYDGCLIFTVGDDEVVALHILFQHVRLPFPREQVDRVVACLTRHLKRVCDPAVRGIDRQVQQHREQSAEYDGKRERPAQQPHVR